MASVMGTENNFWNFPSFTVTDQAEMGSLKSVDFVFISSRAIPMACWRVNIGQLLSFEVVDGLVVREVEKIVRHALLLGTAQ